MRKVMKILFSVAGLLALVLPVLAACSEDENGDGLISVPVNGITASDIQIALVAHSPDSILDDGSFNQGAWAGIQRFLTAHNLPSTNANFYQPHTPDDVTRVDLVELAISEGANFVVLPGFHFIQSAYEMQNLFPDVKFVLLDAIPEDADEVQRIAPNLAAIEYAEEESGFLAGYAIVMEGQRSLGFMGGHTVPAVVRFGHGFLQGAEHAAASLGLAAGEVTVDFMYLGGFAPAPEHAVTAAAWFAGGVEVIFAAAGGAGFSVMSAAESAGTLVIGVDVDQHHESDTVITSAMKALDVSVYDMLTDFLNDNFEGGRAIMFNASINGIGLPMANSRFTNFTQAQYDAIYAELANNTIRVNDSMDMSVILQGLSLVQVTQH
jgi:basic membrane protein A